MAPGRRNAAVGVQRGVERRACNRARARMLRGQFSIGSGGTATRTPAPRRGPIARLEPAGLRFPRSPPAVRFRNLALFTNTALVDANAVEHDRFAATARAGGERYDAPVGGLVARDVRLTTSTAPSAVGQGALASLGGGSAKASNGAQARAAACRASALKAASVAASRRTCATTRRPLPVPADRGAPGARGIALCRRVGGTGHRGAEGQGARHALRRVAGRRRAAYRASLTVSVVACVSGAPRACGVASTGD